MLDGNFLLDLARQYGTPLYVYDLDLVISNYRQLFKFIDYDQLEIHYALKANYNVEILRALQKAGAGIDAVSPAEVLLSLQLGFAPDKIIYTANNMTDAEFAEVHDTGVLMNIGSLSRLRKIVKDYPGSRLCLRFNPDVVDGDNAKTMTGGDLTKFGILMEDLPEVLALVKQGNLHIVGLHAHTGSGLQKAESVYQSMRNLLGLATAKNFPELDFMDFGGGFKVPYRPDESRIDYVAMGREIVRIFEEHNASYGRKLKMFFEPGKYMVAESGYLLTEVNTLKHNRSRLIAGCNAGFPQLIRPVLYGAYHQIFNLSNPSGAKQIYDVCGNICETGDRFAEQRELPEIREYDILAIGNAGAYCYSMGGVYNLRSMPTEVVVTNGQSKLARRALNNRQLVDALLEASK